MHETPTRGARAMRLAVGALFVGLAMIVVALAMLVAEGIAFRTGAGRLALALDATVNLLLGVGALVGVASLPLFAVAKVLERRG